MLPKPNFIIELGFLAISGYVMGCGKLRNQSKIAPGGLSKRESILFFRNLVFAKLEQLGFSLNIAVVMHPNGPKCLRYEIEQLDAPSICKCNVNVNVNV